MPSLENYSRDLDYSYAPGIFPSLEAMLKKPECVRRLLLSSKGTEGPGTEKLLQTADRLHIRVEYADKVLQRISGKDNCFAAAVFDKDVQNLSSGNHIVLHHISDAGNLGTILRTALGFGWKDIAVIRPAADIYAPHVVRSSMGAIFSLRIREYDRFEDYRGEYPNHFCYPFMLDGSVSLEEASTSPRFPCCLIMGNEGAGLPDEFSRLGQPVRIEQSSEIDSLNLAVATAVGMYMFGRHQNHD